MELVFNNLVTARNELKAWLSFMMRHCDNIISKHIADAWRRWRQTVYRIVWSVERWLMWFTSSCMWFLWLIDVLTAEQRGRRRPCRVQPVVSRPVSFAPCPCSCWHHHISHGVLSATRWGHVWGRGGGTGLTQHASHLVKPVLTEARQTLLVYAPVSADSNNARHRLPLYIMHNFNW